MSFRTLPASLEHLLPEDKVGKVSAVQALALGLSSARVYAISSSRGELILRVDDAADKSARWQQQLLILRLAAERGVAPAIVHVDEAEHAIISERVAGVPMAGLSDVKQREAIISSLISQLRELHSLDPRHSAERNPMEYVRRQYAVQRARVGFPAWANQLDPIIDEIASFLDRDPRRVVSHNDLNPGNILWDGKRAWLVDWEIAGLSHPFYDLAVLAMFLQLPDRAAQQLLMLQEQRSIDAVEHAMFANLRRLAALLYATVLMGLVPDLSELSALLQSPKTLPEVYAAMRTGELDLHSTSGRAVFATALLRLGTHGSPAVPVTATDR